MLDVAINAAQSAGAFLLDNFGKVKKITAKGDRNYATELDTHAERMIVEKIKSRFPHHGIIAEEHERSNLDDEWLWIIDPLDGTHNFMHSIDIFGVSIGVVHKKEFVLGVIYMPKDNELYVAEKGSGAYKNSEPINVSNRDELRDCSVSFDSSIRHAPETMLPVLGKVAVSVFNVRMFGSSARLLSYVAEGKIDFAIEFHDQPWDFAAGVTLIREAGGTFTDLKGGAPSATTVGYIASNNITHEKILKEFFT